MAEPGFDPHRLDVAAFARAGAQLQGQWPLAQFARLLVDAAAPTPGAAEVAWAARGEQRPVPGHPPQVWLQLQARAELVLACQRCLQPLPVPLAVDRALRFVEGEAEAERLDADSDDDVLALDHALDLQALIEDELILALPLVPRHAACELPAPAGDAPPEHPFAALQALRRRPQQP